MKKFILILLAFSLVACLPKEIRQKKRCNKRLERLVEKCPQLLSKDTIHDTITVTVPELLIKDSLFVLVDTFELLKYLTKDKIRYVVNSISLDTTIYDKDYTLIFRLNNGLFSHYIRIHEQTINKPIEVVVDVVKPIELSWFEKVQIWIYGKWWLIPLILICAIIYMVAKKYLKSLPFN